MAFKSTVTAAHILTNFLTRGTPQAARAQREIHEAAVQRDLKTLTARLVGVSDAKLGQTELLCEMIRFSACTLLDHLDRSSVIEWPDLTMALMPIVIREKRDDGMYTQFTLDDGSKMFVRSEAEQF